MSGISSFLPLQNGDDGTHLLVGTMHDNVVNLQDHLYDLSRQKQLLLLAYQSLEHLLLLHIVRSLFFIASKQYIFMSKH